MYWTEHSELNSEGLLSWIEYSKLCSNSRMFSLQNTELNIVNVIMMFSKAEVLLF